MSFASPYWLQSWESTQSPFQNMGLWEFCFYKFRHPDYQFDHLFHGCHALYGEEYRLIREKLLPGWLMVVQLFVTLAFITSFLGQLTLISLVLRIPLEWVLRFEWHFCGVAFLCQVVTGKFLSYLISLRQYYQLIFCLSAVLLFLSVCIFGGCCWARDWLLYPNYNYVSWSYALAVFSCLGHFLGAGFLLKDCQDAKERKEKNKALIMQMQGFTGSNSLSSYHLPGSGYI